MRISVSVPSENKTPTHGFGVAGLGMVESLRHLGYTVNYNDATAPVEIAFGHPPSWRWSSPHAHHIGYTPWESTRLPENWIPYMLTADELWATSAWVANVLDRSGFPDVRVYEHGVDSMKWFRQRRMWDGDIKFLHIGEPAERKGGQLVFDTFMDLFAGWKSVSLTIKADHAHGINGLDGFDVQPDGALTLNPIERPANVNVITESLAEDELIQLVYDHDVLVYPSWGEGFGLIPLQAMATGMPVICTSAWAPYKHLILPQYALDSRLVQSPWPDLHPGNMYKPDAMSLYKAMKNITDPGEFQDASVRAYQRSFAVEQQYDWVKLTEKAFENFDVSV